MQTNNNKTGSTNKNKSKKMTEKDNKDMTSAFLILAKSIDRGTETNARLAQGIEKLFPELEKTETAKRLTKDRKKLRSDSKSTLAELGL